MLINVIASQLATTVIFYVAMPYMVAMCIALCIEV